MLKFMASVDRQPSSRHAAGLRAQGLRLPLLTETPGTKSLPPSRTRAHAAAVPCPDPRPVHGNGKLRAPTGESRGERNEPADQGRPTVPGAVKPSRERRPPALCVPDLQLLGGPETTEEPPITQKPQAVDLRLWQERVTRIELALSACEAAIICGRFRG